MFVVLNSVDKIKNFVDTISEFDVDVDIICGKYQVDAKSIMGIFSLDLSKPLQVIVYDKEQIEKVEKSIFCFAK